MAVAGAVRQRKRPCRWGALQPFVQPRRKKPLVPIAAGPRASFPISVFEAFARVRVLHPILVGRPWVTPLRSGFVLRPPLANLPRRICQVFWSRPEPFPPGQPDSPAVKMFCEKKKKKGPKCSRRARRAVGGATEGPRRKRTLGDEPPFFGLAMGGARPPPRKRVEEVSFASPKRPGIGPPGVTCDWPSSECSGPLEVRPGRLGAWSAPGGLGPPPGRVLEAQQKFCGPPSSPAPRISRWWPARPLCT